MGKLSDERLVRRAAEGDRRAYEAIYRRYHQQLYRFCLGLLGNAADAQDALQNTMVKVLRALPGETRRIQLKPWLYRIARNEALELLRRRRQGEALPEELPVPGEIAATAAARERLRLLLTDLEQLPERQRSALVMRELSGLSFAEIATAFGTSPAVARQTLYEARLSLRQMAAGREMRCTEVMRELSDGEGRAIRRRELRAHLHSCAECRAFKDEIGERRDEFAAFAALPAAVAGGILKGVLGVQAASGGIGAGSLGAGTGGAVASSAIAKSAATVVVAAAIGVTAGDRAGLIDVPLPGAGDGAPQSGPATPGRSGADDAPKTHPPDTAPSRNGSVQRTGIEAGARAATGGQSAETTAAGSGQESAGSEQQDGSPTASDKPVMAAGANPPSGGHDAAKRGRRPAGLPNAAAQGQATAAQRKPPHAAAPPGPTASDRGKGQADGAPTATPPQAVDAPSHPAPDKQQDPPFEAEEPKGAGYPQGPTSKEAR